MTTGNEILESIRQLQRFYRNCALLLKTGEATLIKSGWINVHGSIAIANLSKSIDNSDYWAPYYMFRFFDNEKCKNLRVFLSVIIDLPEEPELISEPLLSTGFLNLGEDTTKKWNYYDSTLHLWIPQRKDDGSYFTVDPMRQWPEEGYQYHEFKSMALPLTSITDAKTLEVRIINPLLNELAKCK